MLAAAKLNNKKASLRVIATWLIALLLFMRASIVGAPSLLGRVLRAFMRASIVGAHSSSGCSTTRWNNMGLTFGRLVKKTFQLG